MSCKSRPDSGGFTCIHCRNLVSADAFGTRHRNHCPMCLWSRHLDEEPGDRACPCAQPMQPVAIEVRRDGEWSLVHRCTGCGLLRTNRIAGDDNAMSLLALALRPIAHPAFPLDAFPARI
ncbi:MAG: RNHCP domain-containing protein [Phycisphaerae bacterium]|nr:RNHCP domain-containing protein [Phycisphaerae bacterium]